MNPDQISETRGDFRLFERLKTTSTTCKRDMRAEVDDDSHIPALEPSSPNIVVLLAFLFD